MLLDMRRQRKAKLKRKSHLAGGKEKPKIGYELD
jgi:hypothetical protein